MNFYIDTRPVGSRKNWEYGYFTAKGLIGSCYMTGVSKNTGNINGLFVKEEFRKKGVATELLKRIIDDLGNYITLELGVAQDNTVAVELYKKFGFKPVSCFVQNRDMMFRMIRRRNW